MWTDSDIKIYASWPPSDSVAPGRHRLSLDRYLERQLRHEAARRQYELTTVFGTLRAPVDALMALYRRRMISAKRLTWRDAFLKPKFR